MADRDTVTRVGLDVELGRDRYAPPPVPQADTAFCLALVGDFGGRRDVAVGARGVHLVDVDDLDAVIARVAPTLDLDLGGGGQATVRVASLDDFHPDRLYERLPLFDALRETRARLADPRTFADAAAVLRREEADPPADAPDARQAAGALAGGSLLDSILDATPEAAPGATTGATTGGSGAAAAPRREAPDALQRFIRQAVRAHLVPSPDPRQAEMLASVDAAIADLLRRVLHHPRLRAVEAAWRGVDLLVRRVETGPRLRLAVVDVSRDELAADLAAHDDPREGQLHALLAGAGARFPEPAPWSALVGLAPLHPADDAGLLERLAALGASLGAPWLAAADDAVAAPPVDEDEDDDAPPRPRAPFAPVLDDPRWTAVRRSAHARWLGLLAPGLALRQPYGPDEPCDVVRFDELEPGLGVEDAAARVLWGSASLAGALLLAEAFAADGWEMRPERHRELGGLPMVLVRAPGDTTALPVARHGLGDREALRLVEGGVMPLAAARADDRALLVRWQSAADPATPLAGRWPGAAR